jgi:hypothetical protein
LFLIQFSTDFLESRCVRKRVSGASIWYPTHEVNRAIWMFQNSTCLLWTNHGNGRFSITRALNRMNPGDSKSCDWGRAPGYLRFWFILKATCQGWIFSANQGIHSCGCPSCVSDSRAARYWLSWCKLSESLGFMWISSLVMEKRPLPHLVQTSQLEFWNIQIK